MLEIRLWNPNETGRIGMTDRVPDTVPRIRGCNRSFRIRDVSIEAFWTH